MTLSGCYTGLYIKLGFGVLKGREERWEIAKALKLGRTCLGSCFRKITLAAGV
jgi:hypothetical protein